MNGFLFVFGETDKNINYKYEFDDIEEIKSMRYLYALNAGADLIAYSYKNKKNLDFHYKYDPKTLIVLNGYTENVNYARSNEKCLNELENINRNILAGINKKNSSNILEEIKGSWAFILKQNDQVILITDKICSRNIWYLYNDSKWFIASHPSILWNILNKKLSINPEAFGSLLFASRPSWNKSILGNIGKMQSGQILRLDLKGNVTEEFWYKYIYRPLNISLGEAVEITKHKLAETSKIISSSSKALTLFLSGGIDSRLAAALLSDVKEIETLTLCDKLNYETKLALEVSNILNLQANIKFRDDLWYLRSQARSRDVFSGEYFYTQASYYDSINSHDKSYILGDFLEAFQKIFADKNGQKIIEEYDKLSIDDLLNIYGPYRCPPVPITMRYLADNIKTKVYDAFHESMKMMIKSSSCGNSLMSQEIFNRWGNAFNASTYGMILDIRSASSERSFNLGIIDLLEIIPVEYRKKENISVEVLKKINPHLAKINYSRSHLPLTCPKYITDSVISIRKILSIVKGHTYSYLKTKEYMNSGSWPSIHQLYKYNKQWQNTIESILKSEDYLPGSIFNRVEISKMWDRYKVGRENNRYLIDFMLTISPIINKYSNCELS